VTHKKRLHALRRTKVHLVIRGKSDQINRDSLTGALGIGVSTKFQKGRMERKKGSRGENAQTTSIEIVKDQYAVVRTVRTGGRKPLRERVVGEGKKEGVPG